MERAKPIMQEMKCSSKAHIKTLGYIRLETEDKEDENKNVKDHSKRCGILQGTNFYVAKVWV